MKAYELLATPDKWTQGAFAKDKEGRCVLEYSEAAACFCLLGAIARCYETRDDEIAARSLLARTIESEYTVATDRIVQWNDAKDRTHAEVLAKLKELDI